MTTPRRALFSRARFERDGKHLFSDSTHPTD
jgi:hypothetical protein